MDEQPSGLKNLKIDAALHWRVKEYAHARRENIQTTTERALQRELEGSVSTDNPFNGLQATDIEEVLRYIHLRQTKSNPRIISMIEGLLDIAEGIVR